MYQYVVTVQVEVELKMLESMAAFMEYVNDGVEGATAKTVIPPSAEAPDSEDSDGWLKVPCQH